MKKGSVPKHGIDHSLKMAPIFRKSSRHDNGNRLSDQFDYLTTDVIRKTRHDTNERIFKNVLIAVKGIQSNIEAAASSLSFFVNMSTRLRYL